MNTYLLFCLHEAEFEKIARAGQMSNFIRFCFMITENRTVLPRHSYFQGIPLAINGEPFNSGIEYLNYLFEKQGLYLTRQQVRALHTLPHTDNLIDTPDTLEAYSKYGEFRYYQTDFKYFQF